MVSGPTRGVVLWRHVGWCSVGDDGGVGGQVFYDIPLLVEAPYLPLPELPDRKALYIVNEYITSDDNNSNSNNNNYNNSNNNDNDSSNNNNRTM